MICGRIAENLIKGEKTRFFGMNDHLLWAGYRGHGWCVSYLFPWKDFAEGRIGKVSLMEVPRELRKCERLFLLGNFLERSVYENILVLHLDTGKLDGYMDIMFNAWVEEIAKALEFKDIVREINLIYGTPDTGEIETLYPQTFKRFILDETNTISPRLKEVRIP